MLDQVCYCESKVRLNGHGLHPKPNKAPSFEGNLGNQKVLFKIKNQFITRITRLKKKATS